VILDIRICFLANELVDLLSYNAPVTQLNWYSLLVYHDLLGTVLFHLK
jgi:hypothetical protein